MKDRPHPQSELPYIRYTGYFIDDVERLRERFPHRLKDESVTLLGKHVTIEFEPDGIDNIKIGSKHILKVTSRATDFEAGVDVLILDPDSVDMDNKIPHITLAVREGVAPVAARSVLNAGEFEQLPEPFEVPATQGYRTETAYVTDVK